MSSCTSGYSQEQDKFLSQMYMQVSQDPITGVYQSSNHFWSRVAEAYNNGKNANWSKRSTNSLQTRMQLIVRSTKKFHACLRQCENRCTSGVSQADIFNQTKILLAEDPNFKSGWKFNHVWDILKNFEKFKDGVTSTQTENVNHDFSTQASPGLSSFSPNISDDEIIGESPSQRPSGIKKSKIKRKIDEGTSTVINTLKEGNKLFLEQLKKTSAQRQQHLEIQSKNYAFKECKEENKFLFQDLNSINDLNLRVYVQNEQTRILRKRAEQQQSQQDPPHFDSFGQYFGDLSIFNSDLPKY